MLMYIKLRSGDELFGEVPEHAIEEIDNPAIFRLVKPWRLLLSQKGYVPMPMPLDSVDMKDEDVLLQGPVDKDLTNAYNVQRGDLITPPAGLTLPQ